MSGIKNIAEQPKVSIIIPAYNVERYLEKCLDSLLKQTLQDIEIIVIDDGSTDSTYKIMQDFAKKDERVKIITQTNQKQGAARNRGMEIATGEYISFVDSDDWVDGNYFEKMYEAAKKYDADWVVSNSIRHSGKRQRFHLKYEETKLYEGTEAIVDVLKMQWQPHSKMLKSSLAKQIKYKEQAFFEDSGYIVRFINIAKNIVTVHDASYHYVSNPFSTVRRASIAKDIDRIEAVVDVINFAEENKIKIKEKIIIKEKIGFITIKHYKNRKDYYICGIKAFSKKIDFDNSKTFLVFNTSCFGDVLLCNSLCQNIKRVFPDSKIIFICDKPFYEVAKYQKDVDEVIIYDKKGSHKGIWGFIKFIKSFKYRNILASFVTYNNMRNKFISYFIGAKYILMPNESDKMFSVQERHSRLLKTLTHKNILNLPIRYEVENEVPEALKNILSESGKYIALCTTSKLEEKDMPIETAIEIINKLNSDGEYKLIFVGAGKKAEDYSKTLKEENCNYIDIIGKTSIKELGQVLKLSKALISVDTGTMHLGCAVNTPTVAVFYKRGMAKAWAPNPEVYKTKLITSDQSADNIIAETLKLIGERDA